MVEARGMMRGERMKLNSRVVSGEVGGDGMSVQGSAVREKKSRSKKTPAAAHGSSVINAHHHRRLPSLHAGNSVSTECSSSSDARALRQSASFTASRPKQAGLTSISRRVEDDTAFCIDHNVEVLIRARPVSEAEIAHQASRCVRQEDAQTISWLGQPETRFTFDHVAGEFVTQEEVFRMAGLPMVDKCMAGYNGCIFAYGQTGSGKTHTMLGDDADFENRGMTPRVFEYLFAKIRKQEEAQKQRKLKYKCRCSFLEIYNEQISDLLEPASTNLQMRQDAKEKGVFVEGLLEVEVRNVEDVLHLLLRGAANRKVAATNINRESSRSHSVFTSVIESQWECDSVISSRFGRLNLVDLAGSERQKDTGADEERLREAARINKSLSTLGLVMMVLVDIANGKHRHVPYRDSKLTFLLQDSLGGNSKTTIIANISPSSCASSETLSTLKFAQRAKLIQNNAVINEELASGDVKGLQEKIRQLQDELARVRVSRLLPVSARPKHEALLAELAAERQIAEHFGNEVESHERECRMKLQISVESNKRIASELDALRLELEGLKEECRKHKQDLATLQLKKPLEVGCLELKQAQNQNVVLELKTQLQKSEEKAEDEVLRRNQIEVRLEEALQESTNLQTELQWTRDCLEGAEAVMGNSQHVADNSCPKHDMSSTEHPCYAKEKRKIKHQEAILQLQMELASIGNPLDGTSESYKWKESPGAIDMETLGGERPKLAEEIVQDFDKDSSNAPDSLKERLLHAQMFARCPDTCTIMEAVLQPYQYLEVIKMNLEACNVKLREVGQESEEEVLEIQVRSSIDVLENALLELSTTEAQMQGALDKIKRESLLKKQALVEAEQRYILAEAARLEFEEDLQHLVEMKEEEIVKLKEQGAADLSNRVNLEKPDLQVALGEPEDHFLERYQVIPSLEPNMIERYHANTRKLKSQVETLQLELEKLQSLREEMALIFEELHTSRISSAIMAIQETERLVKNLEEEAKRKQCAIEALEEHLLRSEQSKLQCQEELQRCEREAEVNRTRALEKQVQVEILGKTVEELESTVCALESQVGLLKREGERQCSVGEHMERELPGLEQQNVNLHAALSHKNSTRGSQVRREYNAHSRKLDEREAGIQLLHQTGTQRKKSSSQPKDVHKAKKINCLDKGSLGSAFRWFKSNHGQVHSELGEGRKAYERRIQELENALTKRQLEIIALQEKRADAERVTHGVKVDMVNAADEEVGRMLTQLNNFTEEREGWLEIISRKQTELIAAQLAMENLQEHKQALVAENKKLKNENRMQAKRFGQLEQEGKTLSGQQTKHHVK